MKSFGKNIQNMNILEIKIHEVAFDLQAIKGIGVNNRLISNWPTDYSRCPSGSKVPRPDFTAAQLDYKQLQNTDRQAKARKPTSFNENSSEQISSLTHMIKISGSAALCRIKLFWLTSSHIPGQVDFFELLLAKAVPSTAWYQCTPVRRWWRMPRAMQSKRLDGTKRLARART